MRRVLLLLVPLLLLCAGSAQAKPLLGIADQKPSTFDDPRLQSLMLKDARLYLPWDILSDKNTLPEVDLWMANAKRDGFRTIVTIARSRQAGRKSVNPSPTKLAREFKKWRKRWPGQVDQVAAWNEANIGKKPELVAKWWLALRKACPSCTILGADLLDDPAVLAWTARFIKTAKRAPAVWGLHAYNDANTFSTKSTKALLKGLKGDIWITETGGVANRLRPAYRFAGCGVAHETKATSYLLTKIARLSPRIKRIYLFNWGLGSNGTSFDSALVDAEGRERPSLNVVRKYLGQPPVAAPLGGFSPELASCNKGVAKVKIPRKKH